jgi:hypothetical protein
VESNRGYLFIGARAIHFLAGVFKAPVELARSLLIGSRHEQPILPRRLDEQVATAHLRLEKALDIGPLAWMGIAIHKDV